jgi:hypothetical protein
MIMRSKESVLLSNYSFRFKTLHALREHQQGKSLEEWNKITAAEDLHVKPPLVHVVKPVSGFSI